MYYIQHPEFFKKKSRELLYAVQLAFLIVHFSPKNQENKNLGEYINNLTSLSKKPRIGGFPSIRGFVLDIFDERDFGSSLCVHDNFIHQRLHEINAKASRL